MNLRRNSQNTKRVIAVDSEGSQLARELPSGITESKKIIIIM